MNDTIITVRMPRGLIKDLRKVTEEHHFMDISETIRSILRKKYVELYVKKNDEE